jgi:orotate phosphoribosyltransferase
MPGMDDQHILEIFRTSQALLQGHFLLTSGYHSPTYFQCAKVLQYPAYTTKLCSEMIKKTGLLELEAVVSPAIGGIVVGQEVGRLLNKRAIFTEREEGKMAFRRGFEVQENEKVLVVEDVVTTGGSVLEVIELVQRAGGVPVGVAVIVDRSNGQVEFPVPYYSLIALEAVKYAPEECPLCKAGEPLVKPGSRKNC